MNGSGDNTLDSVLKSKLNDVGAYAKYLRDGVKSLVDYLDYLISDVSLNRDIKLSELVDNREHPINQQRKRLIEIQSYLMSINIYSLDKSHISKLEEIATTLNEVTSYLEGLKLLDFS